MSVWERYQDQRSQSTQDRSIEERIAENRREREQKDAAKRAAEQAKVDAVKAASTKLFQSTNTLGMLNEIANHVPGATVKVEDKSRCGYLTASVKWQRDVDVHDVYTGQHRTKQVEYGVEVHYGGPANRYPEGYLSVQNSGGLLDSYSPHSSDLEGQLAETLGKELDRTGKPLMTSSEPSQPGPSPYPTWGSLGRGQPK